MDAGTRNAVLPQRKISRPRFLLLFATAIPALLKATMAVCGPAPATSALPLTDWDYGFNRCDIWHNGYSVETAAIEEGMAAYYGVCGDQSVYSITPWGTPENPVKSACGTKVYPTWPWDYTLGIEIHNQRKLLVEYCGGVDGMNIRRIRTAGCPEGYTASGYTCLLTGANPLKDAGQPCPHTGNPVNPASGNKYLHETDYSPASLTAIRFERHYNSKTIFAGSTAAPFVGNHWTHSYTRVISPYDNGSIATAIVRRPNGQAFYFSFDESTASWVSDPDVKDQLEQLTDGSGGVTGWRYTASDDTVELYDSAGRLLSITDLAGRTQTLAYETQPYDTPPRLVRIDAGTGEFLELGYDTEGRLGSITDHTGRIRRYRYDAGNNLEYVDHPDGLTRQYHYEDSGFPVALTGITDERGKRYATYVYDSQGRAITSTHAGDANRVDIVYKPDGIRTVTNSKGFASTYKSIVQIGKSLITDISGPGCATCGTGNTGYSYDPLTNDLLLKTVNGITTEYGDYDASGNPGFRIEARGTLDERRTDYTYDPRYHGRITTITEPSVHAGSNRVTTYTYDVFGNRTSESIAGFDPNGNPVTRTTTYQYDGPLHQLSRVDGPRTDASDITLLRYYPDDPQEGSNRARLQEVEDAAGTLIRSNLQYTAAGQLESEERPNGLHLHYTYYPGNDRLETLTETAGTTDKITRWTYLATGEVESITIANGDPVATTLNLGYDDARRLNKVTDSLGNYIEYAVDTEGNIEHEYTHDSSGVLHRTLTRTFDLYNRLDATSQANESLDYDFAPDGNLDRQTDGNGTVTGFSYDNLKRLVASTRDAEASGAYTRYDYDVADRLARIIDPNSGTTGFQYDDLGNLLRISSPDTGTTVHTYDAAGNVKTRQDAAGQLFRYSYDALNRLKTVDAPGTTEDIAYGYDACAGGAGRLCNVTIGAGSVNWAYDAFGNVTDHQQLAYRYDAASRIETITYPSGAVVTYGYDAAGRVSQVDLTVESTTTTLAGNITYAPFGPVTSLAFGNGATLVQNVDSAFRFTDQTIAGILGLGYPLYDGNGNLKTRTDGFSGTSTFGYDALDRLDVASGAFGNRDYDYGLNGNRLRLLSDATATNYGYETGSNRLVTETGWSYNLDANGNTTAKLDADGAGRLYAYSTHNRLVGATERALLAPGDPPTYQEALLGSYRYNGLGQRSAKTTGNGTSQFLYGVDGALMAELDGNGTVQREYIYLNNELLAVRAFEVIQNGGDEVVLDNGQAGTYGTGNWSTRSSSQDYGVDYRLANRNNRPCTYRWTPALDAGTYAVYAWWVSKGNYTSNAPYTVRHDGQTEAVYKDHTVNGGGWQLLGTFNFDGSGGEYIEVSNANGKVTADAVRLVKEITTIPHTNLYYVHNDHLGTPQAMTDAIGSVVWRAHYDPFGHATIDAASTTALNVRFPGQYFDAETGLHYNYYRYYDPESGRYLTADPRGQLLDFSDPARQVAATTGIDIPRRNNFGYLNHIYGYVDNNPINRADPTGEIDPVTAGLIIWGLLYINNAGDAISDPNGNLWGEPQDQDNVCTLPFPIGPIADQCVLDRCQRHDVCYDENGCTASSWIPSLLGGTKPCNQCNSGFFQ